MQIFDRYLFRSVGAAFLATAAALTAIIFLTQSLRFLELVINAGASGGAFWTLTALALPRSFEIVLPIAIMVATLFVYNRLTMDCELVVARGLGSSPGQMARPALALAALVSIFLIFVTMWLAPASLAGMQKMRLMVKAQYSQLLFREGVFNVVRPGLTVFVRERLEDGTLAGLMIHDARPDVKAPSTIIAKRGQLLIAPEGQQVLVYEGSRQTRNENTGAVDRLDFERYTIDIPETSGPIRQRWREPDERTVFELLSPDPRSAEDNARRRDFMVEIHRRIAAPFLALSFTVIALSFLLLGPVDRRGQGWRLAAAVIATLIVQGAYMASLSLSTQSPAGLVLMYAIVFTPLAAGAWLLYGRGDNLFRDSNKAAGSHPAWEGGA